MIPITEAVCSAYREQKIHEKDVMRWLILRHLQQDENELGLPIGILARHWGMVIPTVRKTLPALIENQLITILDWEERRPIYLTCDSTRTVATFPPKWLKQAQNYQITPKELMFLVWLCVQSHEQEAFRLSLAQIRKDMRLDVNEVRKLERWAIQKGYVSVSKMPNGELWYELHRT